MSYHVAQNGTQLGVLSEQDIVNRLASGQLSNEDLFWTDGMADWQPLGSKFRAPSAFPPPSPAVPPEPPVLLVVIVVPPEPPCSGGDLL